MSSDSERMLKAQLKFVAKHYGSPGCGFLQRQIALARIYRQHAETLGSRGQLGAAMRSVMRSMAFYPLDMGSARVAGALLLRRTGLTG
jgi:hypothetical protein